MRIHSDILANTTPTHLDTQSHTRNARRHLAHKRTHLHTRTRTVSPTHTRASTQTLSLSLCLSVSMPLSLSHSMREIPGRTLDFPSSLSSHNMVHSRRVCMK